MLFAVDTGTSQAEDLLRASNPDKEYLPITGLPEFTKNATKLAYGADSAPLNANAVRMPSSLIRPYTDATTYHRSPPLSRFLGLARFVLAVHSWHGSILTLK